jgi:transcriptional regulator with XRE-family HTH domain
MGEVSIFRNFSPLIVRLPIDILISMNKKISAHAIPNCLRKYRLIRGLKQKQVASILGLKNAGRISQWENGVYFPGIVNLFKLAILYRTMPDALLIDLTHMLRHMICEQEEKVLGKEKENNGKR